MKSCAGPLLRKGQSAQTHQHAGDRLAAATSDCRIRGQWRLRSHLRSLRRNFAAQIQTMSEAVVAAFPAEIKLSLPAGGFVLWIELPKKVSALKLHERALAEKFSIAPGPMSAPGVRLRGFASCRFRIVLRVGKPASPFRTGDPSRKRRRAAACPALQ